MPAINEGLAPDKKDCGDEENATPVCVGWIRRLISGPMQEFGIRQWAKIFRPMLCLSN